MSADAFCADQDRIHALRRIGNMIHIPASGSSTPNKLGRSRMPAGGIVSGKVLCRKRSQRICILALPDFVGADDEGWTRYRLVPLLFRFRLQRLAPALQELSVLTENDDLVS